MEELIKFIKSKCSREEIRELVKELSTKEEPKENDVPRTWEEYIKSCRDTKGYYIDIFSDIRTTNDFTNADERRNTLPTKELAEAFLAMMQLMSLRQAWIKSWKPDWNDETIYKYCIVFVENSPKIDKFWYCHKVLSFPTKEMAGDFFECFKDLVEKAKILL